jgi:hypothetical protein
LAQDLYRWNVAKPAWGCRIKNLIEKTLAILSNHFGYSPTLSLTSGEATFLDTVSLALQPCFIAVLEKPISCHDRKTIEGKLKTHVVVAMSSSFSSL